MQNPSDILILVEAIDRQCEGRCALKESRQYLEGRQAGLERQVDLYKLGVGLRTWGSPTLVFPGSSPMLKLKKNPSGLEEGNQCLCHYFKKLLQFNVSIANFQCSTAVVYGCQAC